MKKQLSKENLQEQLTSQYKVFRLTKDGSEEMDFVEWASNETRNHPIAKAYQNIRNKNARLPGHARSPGNKSLDKNNSKEERILKS
jgi:hypothetical protein